MSTVQMDLQVELNYDVGAQGADFIVNIHAARTPAQTVLEESLLVSQAIAAPVHADPATGKIHGLVHKQTFDLSCMCQACMSRR